MRSPDSDRLAMTDEEVSKLTRREREARVRDLIAESYSLLDFAIESMIYNDDKEVAGIVVLFSGGNDSTVAAHLFRERATHFAHANTGVGVEQTRDYVRSVARAWGVPLIEKRAPRSMDSYRALVLDQGFPGPAHHFKMYQRLKERALRQVRAELVSNPRRQRVVFVAGRRRQESARRANVPEWEREGSIVWVSPLVNWTKLDMSTYRLLSGDVPRNEVSDLIHMSGECLCGAFAHKGERQEIELWYPSAFEEIAELERLIADRPDIPDERKAWGWGWSRSARSVKSGRLCSTCAARREEDQGNLEEVVA